MRKLQVFEVMFNGNVDVFRAGDTVTGYVRIVLNQKKDLKGRCFFFLCLQSLKFNMNQLYSTQYYDQRSTAMTV